jgi:hypothetical protein
MAYYEDLAAFGPLDARRPDGSRRLFYVAPSLVLHYVDAHEYLPPESFQRAVMACPPMRSMEYLRAISRHGLHKLGRRQT